MTADGSPGSALPGTAISRRAVLGGAAAAAAGAVTGLSSGGCASARRISAGASERPNVLVIMVDEMRFPMWFPDRDRLDVLLPNIARIRRGAVSLEGHYTAANVCTAARGTLLTGLYSHQTGCLLVDRSTLSPKFPTWGSMVREYGYRSFWYGKWHLGPAPNTDPAALAAYGFEGGTFPSPGAAPGDGLAHDAGIADQFVSWFDGNAENGPWCTTVSLVNPHDVMYWPKWPAPQPIPSRFTALPPNFETPEQLRARSKPRTQVARVESAQTRAGVMPYSGDDVTVRWAQYLDLYLWLQQQVDTQIGRVLDTLATRPQVEANTIVVFTADHGEYGGSHGMRTKGDGLYEEGIRIPFYVRDPTGVLTPDPGGVRSQLTSSVDVAPLILTIATGGDQWRTERRYEHLAERADLAAICRDPAARGRTWIAHTTDEAGRAREQAPSHIVGVRTPEAKAGLYSFWSDGTTRIDPTAEQDREFYDYSTEEGRLELSDQADIGAEGWQLHQFLLETVLPDEVNQPLPDYLRAAQEEGLADHAALSAKE